MSRVVVLGAGGFCHEVLDTLDAMQRAGLGSHVVAGVVDDDPEAASLSAVRARGLRYLGPLRDWLASRPDAKYTIGIGSGRVRKNIDAQCQQAGLKAYSAIHPSASLGFNCRVGSGSVICAGAIISANVRLGRNTHLNPGCVIGHDVDIGDNTSVNPGAVVSGNCRIGEAALLGAKSVVLQGLTVGEAATVGAAACVVRDVAPWSTVRGVPAR